MELEIENTEVVSSNEIQVDVPTSIEVIEGEKDYEVSVVKKEYTIIGDSIFIPSMYEDAPPWLKEFIDTTINVAVTYRDQSLIDRLESLLSLLDYVPKNQYTEQINQIVSEDGIINSRIATLNSSFSDAINSTNATIAEINLTYASKNEAAAIAANILSASLSGSGQIGSTLIQLQEAYADLESTTAQSVNALESVMEGEINGNAQAMETIRTYVGIDEAGAGTGTGLSAYLESSDGTIGGADSQLANTIRVTSEGVESKFAYNSVVNINGIYKKSGFGLTTNYTSGNGTQANPYISEFWIDASRFKFTNSNQTGQVAPFTIDATGATPQIAFNGIVNFSNVSNVQNSGSNLLYNSAPKIGYETKGWSIGWSNHGLSSNIGAGFDSWKPTGGASVFIQVHGSPAVGSVFDINNSSFPVVAGNKYEASAYISSHRCTSYVTIAWYNSSNTYISESSGTIVNLNSSGALSGWARSTLIVTAPTGAVKGLFYVRSSVTGDNPYCFVSYAFAGKVLSNQTVVSDWSEGTSVSISSGDVVTDINAGNTTTINGGKITTGSIAANKFAPATGSSSTWTGGGLVSDNFNGNPVGSIGNPTQGFRLSSNAAGSAADPNIYGAVIRASYLVKGSYIIDPNTGAYGHSLCSVSVGTTNGAGDNPSGYSDQFAFQGNIADLSSVIISNNCRISVAGTITGYGTGINTVVTLYLDVVDAASNVYARHLVQSNPFAFGGRALWSFGYGNNLDVYIPTNYRLRLAILTGGYNGDLHISRFNVSWSNM